VGHLGKMRRYITTPIYYVNGDPHIGHCHTSVMGDIIARCAKIRGENVFFTTGTDEHGQKNQRAAEDSGLAVEQYLDQQSGKFRGLFDRLSVSYDFFVRTTYPQHKAAVTKVLNILREKNLIVKKEYSGLYCEGCEQFKKLSDLDERGFCQDHQAAPLAMNETNYFLRLGEFQDWLIDYVASNEGSIQPEVFRQEVLSMLREPLDDMCISRPKTRVWLGIEFPYDRDYVTYVWFDALVNYISNLGWPDDSTRVSSWWPNATHLMAKDIIKTHCIYWPIMLRALGLEPPHACRVHGYWVGEGGVKMSKSLGNVVDPVAMIDIIGADAFRFYLAKSMGKREAQVSARLLRDCYDKELANNLGNLHARVLKMASQYFEGVVPPSDAVDSDGRALLNEVSVKATAVFPRGDLLQEVTDQATALLQLGRAINLYVNQSAPWMLAKDPSQRTRLAGVLYGCLDALRIVMELAQPIMPNVASRALSSIGAASACFEKWTDRFQPNGLRPGSPLSFDDLLFPRLP
jgi:methionyl-tRNA synthetase